MKYPIRDATGEDIPFIYSTWSNSYRTDSDTGRNMPKSLYYKYIIPIIDGILQRALTRTIVIHDPKDEFVIWGYLVYEPQVIHYIFVKEAFRRAFIATDLITYAVDQTVEIQYSHKTDQWKQLVRSKDQFIYNQLMLFKTGVSDGKS